MFNEEEIKNGLETSFIGRHSIIIYNETDSTNNRAFSLAEKSYPEGTIVIAEMQSDGKGRMGRKWASIPEKSLSVSIILRPQINPAAVSGITLVIAVALSDTLHGFSIHSHKIKWPNDLLINNKKISGILNELKITSGKTEFIITGIGINLGPVLNEMPEELKGVASSVYDETGIEIDRTVFLQKFLVDIEKRYNEFQYNGLNNILKEWKLNSDLIGKRITVNNNSQDITGTVKDLNSDGSLSIETRDGLVKVFSGEIRVL